MRYVLCLTAAFAVVIPADAQDHSNEKRITEALLAAPESLRSGATVVYDRAPGDREILRKGTSNLICRADTPAPGFLVRCHHSEMDAFFTRTEELVAEGRSLDEQRDILSAEVRAGKLKVVEGSIEYLVNGPMRMLARPGNALFLPNASGESTGLSEDATVHRPWLMWAGTPVAHVMLK